MTYRRTFVLSLLLVVPCDGAAAADKPCVPIFLQVTQKPLQVELGGKSNITVEAAVIGCEADLARLGPAEITSIQRVLEKIVSESHLAVGLERRDLAFRRSMAKRINEALRLEAVSDVYISRFSFSEALGG